MTDTTKPAPAPAFRDPDPGHDALDHALEETFPASDPVSIPGPRGPDRRFDAPDASPPDASPPGTAPASVSGPTNPR